MSEAENVKRLCAIKGIRVSALEKALGFGNGYINPKKVKHFSHERLVRIAEYLGVSIEEITGQEQEKPVPTNGNGYVDQFTEAAARLFGDHPEKLLRLLDALEKDPEKTKAKFDLFLATL